MVAQRRIQQLVARRHRAADLAGHTDAQQRALERAERLDDHHRHRQRLQPLRQPVCRGGAGGAWRLAAEGGAGRTTADATICAPVRACSVCLSTPELVMLTNISGAVAGGTADSAPTRLGRASCGSGGGGGAPQAAVQAGGRQATPPARGPTSPHLWCAGSPGHAAAVGSCHRGPPGLGAPPAPPATLAARPGRRGGRRALLLAAPACFLGEPCTRGVSLRRLSALALCAGGDRSFEWRGCGVWRPQGGCASGGGFADRSGSRGMPFLGGAACTPCRSPPSPVFTAVRIASSSWRSRPPAAGRSASTSTLVLRRGSRPPSFEAAIRAWRAPWPV